MSQHQNESVVIVGGGIIGLACAHYLSSAGLQVTVIDRGRIAGACSHANCGYISPSHVLPLTEPGAIRMALKSMLNPDAPFRVRPAVESRLLELDVAIRTSVQSSNDDRGGRPLEVDS